MQQEKLQTIRTTNGELEMKRVPKSEANKLIATGEWTASSKSKYDKYLKDQRPRYSGGDPYSKINSKPNKSLNNRASKRGRNYKDQVVTDRIDAKTDLGYDIHQSVTYKNTVDPRTGNYTTSKCGKAIVKEEIIVHYKDKPIKTVFSSIKHLIYSQTANFVSKLMLNKS